MSTLSGKVAIVTGAASGIGRAGAEALAAAGADVVLFDVDEEGLGETLAAVRKTGARGSMSVGDVRSSDDLARVVGEAVVGFGGLDVMFANAAVGKYEALETMSEDDIGRLLEVNLTGALLSAKHAIAALRARGGGSIVFTSSVQAYLTLPGCVAYGAAKAGLVAAARALAAEVGPDGIRVNVIAPGTIDTPMLRRDLSGMNVEEADGFRRRIEASTALGRIGDAAEIGAVLTFLVSDAASYITGSTIVADGGFLSVKRF